MYKRIEYFDTIIELYGGAKRLGSASASAPELAWYHTAPSITTPVVIKDANPLGIPAPDYLGFQIACPCGGVMVDAGYADEEETVLECISCKERRTMPNLEYRSDHPDSKWGEPTEINVIFNEKDYNDLILEMADNLWRPIIPRNRRELWSLQKHLGYFCKVAMAYNNRLKSIIKAIDILKKSKRDNLKLSKLFAKRKGKHYLSGATLFAMYADKIDGDQKAVDWIRDNWEALRLKDEFNKQPSWVGRIPMTTDNDGNTVNMEIDSATGEQMWDYRKITPGDYYVEKYIAKNLLRSWNGCLKVLDNTKFTSEWRCEDLRELVMYCKSKRITHPHSERHAKWRGMTWATLERSLEEF